MLLENYVYVCFIVNSPYEWGRGIDRETYKVFSKEAVDILNGIGLTVTEDGCSPYSSPQGQHEGERLYMHPMTFSGILTKERFKRAKELIENYGSDIFSVRSIKTFNIDSSYRLDEFNDNLKKWEELKKQGLTT